MNQFECVIPILNVKNFAASMDYYADDAGDDYDDITISSSGNISSTISMTTAMMIATTAAAITTTSAATTDTRWRPMR